jgi:hypothetical protein
MNANLFEGKLVRLAATNPESLGEGRVRLVERYRIFSPVR